MTQYIIYFNQQWVGEHSPESIAERGRRAHDVVEEMKRAGVYVVAGGVDENLDNAFSADDTGGTLVITDGPYPAQDARLGGLTIVDVADDTAAKLWAGKLAEACGWPQEVRRIF
ncbi:YciI family protein [Brachybacterium sp. GCM10030267]|uniref:YciI family protein n=1 Tax=unclassified Brachybacterium TaxID=2623841 RepID=UPI0036205360